MEKDQSGFYVIDALSLQSPAGKPHFVADRLKSKSRQRSGNNSDNSNKNVANNSDNISGNGSNNGDSNDNNNDDNIIVEGPSVAELSDTDGVNMDGSNNNGIGNGNAFIEARRSRLAKRHSHVNDVMGKHKKSVFEAINDPLAQRRISESLDRAGRNRARLIDSQVRKSASKVARVKQVAAEQRLKSVERKDSLRRNLEERLRASEIRRRQLQSIPRSRLLDAREMVALHKNVDEQEVEKIRLASAVVIQHWWRLKYADRVVKLWSKTNLSLARAKSLPFEKLAKLVQSKQVIKGTTVLISYLKSFASQLPQKVDIVFKNSARIFLSSYMIIAHTSEIMPSMGHDEEIVKQAATDLLENFEGWINISSSSSKIFPLSTVVRLLNSWISYFTKFESWKERDTMKIVDGLISHYLELENLWLSVKDQIDADVQWKPRVEEEQLLIFGRLQKFGDKALERFTTARRNLHAQFGINALPEDLSKMSVDVNGISDGDELSVTEGISISDIRTKGASHQSFSQSKHSPSTSLLATSPQAFPGRLQALKSTTDSVARPNSVSPSPHDRRSATPPPVAIPPKPDFERPRTPLITATSNEKLNFLASTPGFGDIFTNEKLAHELTLDPEFSLKKPVLSDLEMNIRDAARRAFFDQVKQEFAQGNFEVYIPDLVGDMKQQILSMVSEKGKIAAEIEEALDMEFIIHQIKNDSLDLVRILQFVASKMAQLCAPLRDAAVKAINVNLSNVNDYRSIVPIIDSILLVLDDMKLDLANYKLQTLRPHLKTQAIEYEKSKFKESLAAYQRQSLAPSSSANISTATLLPRTKAWLSETAAMKIQIAKQRNPENIDLPENKVRYTDTLHDALLGLVFSNSAVTLDTVPETLAMDCERVFGFQNDGQLIVIVAAILMLVQNIFAEGRGDKTFLTLLKDRLVAILKDSDGLSVENLSLEIIRLCDAMVIEKRKREFNLIERTKNSVNAEGLDETRKGLIRSMVDKTLSTKDPVFGLLRRRVQSCVKSHVITGNFKREGLDKAGLDIIRTEVEAFSYRVAIWVRYNAEVYGEWYDEILKEIL